MTNSNEFSTGIHYFLKGLQSLWKPGIRRYVIVPFFINLILFASMIALGIHWFSEFTAWINHLLPTWLHWLNWLLWLLFIFSVFIIMTYTFTLIANFIATPFNSVLSEKVEKLTGKEINSNKGDVSAVIKAIPRDLKRQLQFIGYYLLRALVCLILFFIPIVQIAAGVIWFLFNAWMMTVQYTDYPMDNHDISFLKMRRMLTQKRSVNLGFGCAVMACSLIPIVNFIVMPAAVIGATYLWVDQYGSSEIAPTDPATLPL